MLDLNGRLADAERHQASLEEKHKHARDALEHYGTAAKDQREQEQRRHEHQVQGLQTELKQAQLAFSLKQEELTRLNKEAAALATELGSVKQALHLEREASRNQAKKLEQLQAVEARAAVLEAQLVDSRTRLPEAGETAARGQRVRRIAVANLRARSGTICGEKCNRVGRTLNEAGESSVWW